MKVYNTGRPCRSNSIKKIGPQFSNGIWLVRHLFQRTASLCLQAHELVYTLTLQELGHESQLIVSGRSLILNWSSMYCIPKKPTWTRCGSIYHTLSLCTWIIPHTVWSTDISFCWLPRILYCQHFPCMSNCLVMLENTWDVRHSSSWSNMHSV